MLHPHQKWSPNSVGLSVHYHLKKFEFIPKQTTNFTSFYGCWACHLICSPCMLNGPSGYSITITFSLCFYNISSLSAACPRQQPHVLDLVCTAVKVMTLKLCISLLIKYWETNLSNTVFVPQQCQRKTKDQLNKGGERMIKRDDIFTLKSEQQH